MSNAGESVQHEINTKEARMTPSDTPDTPRVSPPAGPSLRTREEAGLGANERYARQTLFTGIKREGQERISQGRVLVVGCGALGTVLANNLVRAGVGYVRIVDRDFVEGNNLQRQVLFDEQDVLRGLPKAVAAAEELRGINSLVEVDARVEDLTAENVEELIAGMDLALDGTDNFETRYLLNDACLKAGIPWIYSGVIAAYGVTMTILPHDTACLRCVFPERPLPGTTPTCDTAGVLNGIVGVVAGMAATEALKLLVGSPQLVRGLTWIDLWENTFDRIELPRQEDCRRLRSGALRVSRRPAGFRRRLALRAQRRAGARARGDERDLAELAERLRPVGRCRDQWLPAAPARGWLRADGLPRRARHREGDR